MSHEAVRLEDGLPFVRFRTGDTYRIRLINNSPHEAAVRLAIDGLSVFDRQLCGRDLNDLGKVMGSLRGVLIGMQGSRQIKMNAGIVWGKFQCFRLPFDGFFKLSQFGVCSGKRIQGTGVVPFQ